MSGVEEDGLAREQARLLRRAIDHAGLSLPEVWFYYFSLGGNVGQLEVEAYLNHALPLPGLERDVLAHAVNEMIDHRPALYAPYTCDLGNSGAAGGDCSGGEDDADGHDGQDDSGPV